MSDTTINVKSGGGFSFFSPRTSLEVGAVAAFSGAALSLAAGRNYASAFFICLAAILLVWRSPSVETLLIVWFVGTPLASFVVRFPMDRSIVTFDRIFLLAAFITVAWRQGQTGLRNLKITAFEVGWAALAVLAMTSALLKSHDIGGAVRIAFDSFWLPLVAFCLARHYFKLDSNARLILACAMALGIFLAGTGVIEFATGQDLFQYKGADLFRAHERRVNGPFASDSSYSIISLISMIFLIQAPRAFSLKLDASATIARYFSIAATVVGTVLPLFRGTVMAIVACWFTVKLAWRGANIPKKQQPSARWGSVYGVVISVLALSAMGYLDLGAVSSRLTDPHNLVGRLSTWNTAFVAMVDNPGFGVGLNEYKSYFHETYYIEDDPVGVALDAKAVDSPHSNFLWIGAELGIPALLLYSFSIGNLILISVRGLKRSRSAAAAVCSLALIVAYVVPGIELTSGYYSDLNLFFFFLMGLLASRFSLEATEEGVKQD
jgi:O-antigen ligase